MRTPAGMLADPDAVAAARDVLAVVTAAATFDFDSMAAVLEDMGDLDPAVAGSLGFAWLAVHLVAEATGAPMGTVLMAVGKQLSMVEARLAIGGTVGSGG